MRLTAVYLKNHARVPQNEKKVPYKEVFPLKLRNRYEGASKNTKEKNCLFEMSLLFACMKDNNFENKLCDSQIEKFQSCVTNYEKYRSHQKQLQQIGVPTPDTVNFTDPQLTYLLRKFPTL
ncbi:small ribosomal subunit protein mS37 [Andrena cerasifolii]|uniref:small ribosomal subunit protein mS37 n=1 Tax=Andrena cerasifolii TaxID=2819439 RepID=UPI0040381C9E